MTNPPPSNRPLDSALKERLHLSGKNPLLLRLIRGVINGSDALSRWTRGHPFLALKESEDLLVQYHGLKGHDLVQAVLTHNGGTHLTPLGLENVPPNGPVVIAATHPTGMFDFVAHAGILMRKRPDLKVVANMEVQKFLGPEIIVPVCIDKQNRATSGTETALAMQHHLETDGALLIFGSGRVPDLRRGALVEPEWRRGASSVSETTQAPIIPAGLNARNSGTYYRLRAIARFFSGGNDDFGAMIGSLRYTAELLEKLGGAYEVSYGAPLPPGTEPETIKLLAEGQFPDLYGRPQPTDMAGG